MYKARTIKKLITVEAVLSLILIYGGIALSSFIRDMKGSSQFFWSSDVREAVSFFSGLSTFCLIAGVVCLCIAIALSKLKKTGRVCSNCELVYTKTAVSCPKCGADLACAKNVDEYLREKHTVSKSTPSASGNVSSLNASITEDKTEVSNKRFCEQCGQKINSESAFCPHCGTKQ